MADDDDEAFGGVYHDGHWEWNESSNSLVFVSDQQQQTLEVPYITSKAPTGAIEFRDNVDVVEQIQDDARDLNGMSQPTISLVCKQVALALVEERTQWIKMPQTEQEQNRTIAGFFSICGFRQVIGAIDCTHIRIPKVGGDIGQYYINRKGYSSINVQIRYRRRYQRKVKPGDPDVVTIQDIKDIAIYTAPVSIQSSGLINILHLPTTERFLRALILYCQYYLQVAEEMARRNLELETKIRTPQCDVLEDEYRDNLADLRLLVAKEYSTIIIGGADTRKYHHMGQQKRRRSLSEKDARQFETLVRMCVQVVWLALGRKYFNQIELEINRMFKSEIFNTVEHTLKTDYLAKMGTEERHTLIGQCARHDKKLHTRSPLMNEVFCHRDIDYRLMALGVIKCLPPTPRLQYFMHAVAGPEDALAKAHVTVGILGLPRSTFDSMLKPIPVPTVESKMAMDRSQQHCSGKLSSTPSVGSKKAAKVQADTIPTIALPPAQKPTYFPTTFTQENEKILPCSERQRRKWQNRLQRLLHPYTSRQTPIK